MRVLVVVVFFLLPLQAQTEYRPANWVWRGSVATLWTGDALDMASSWGYSEYYPFWRSRDGTFGTRGMLKSVGINAGVTGAQYAGLRFVRNPYLRATIFGASVALNLRWGIIGIRQARRNWSVPN